MTWPYRISQFLACLETIYIIPDSFSLPECTLGTVVAWLDLFYAQINYSRLGYPKCLVYETPVLEDQLHEFVRRYKLDLVLIKRDLPPPTIYLSHDVDYLKPTWPLKLKRRKLLGSITENFLESIISILSYDASVAGPNSSTFFVAAPTPLQQPFERGIQWLIDPGYFNDSLLTETLELLNSYNVEVGLHGSIYSLALGSLGSEKARLEEKLGRSVTSLRQHWLRLPSGLNSLEQVSKCGFKVDSTLGWNGQVGFRSGMARPFALKFTEGFTLWEVPQLLMDGVLFDSLNLGTNEVVSLSKKLLTEVFNRHGAVALNWHERSASSDYGWFDAYRRIIDWSYKKGFKFSGVTDAKPNYR